MTAPAKIHRMRTPDGKQLVVIDQSLTYSWRGEPLAVGDRVLLPENYVSAMKFGHGPFSGTVTSLDSTYAGRISEIIRKI